jgi:plasmid stability protein
MKSILIRDIDPGTLAALKHLARTHHRSLQGELHAIIERATRAAPAGDRQLDLQLHTVRTDASQTWSREEIYDDQR